MNSRLCLSLFAIAFSCMLIQTVGAQTAKPARPPSPALIQPDPLEPLLEALGYRAVQAGLHDRETGCQRLQALPPPQVMTEPSRQ